MLLAVAIMGEPKSMGEGVVKDREKQEEEEEVEMEEEEEEGEEEEEEEEEIGKSDVDIHRPKSGHTLYITHQQLGV